MDAAHSPHARSPIARVAWPWLAVVTGLYTTAIVLYTVYFGRLASYVMFDDVHYYTDALVRLRDLTENGLGSFLQGWVDKPIHAPFSTLAAMLSFAILGVKDWAPLVMNSLGVVLGLVAIERILRRQGPAVVALGWLFWLCAPTAINGVINFRPDFTSALCAGIGTLYSARLFSRSGDRVAVIAGVFFGLALLCKTTTFPLNLLALGTSVCASFWTEFFLMGRKVGSRLVARRCLLLATPLALLIAPHYYVARQEIYDYIHLTLYHKEMGQTLAYQKGPLKAALYYVFGSGGQFHLGSYMFIVYPALGFGARWAARHRRLSWRAAYVCSLMMVALTLLAFLIVLKHKSQFHGGLLMVLCLFITLLLARFGLERLRAGGVNLARWRPAAVALAAVLPVTIVVAPHRIAKFTPYYSEEQTQIRRGFQELFDELTCIQMQQPQKPLKVYFAFSSTINDAHIAWMATQRRVPLETRVDWLHTDPQKQLEFARAADVIVLGSDRCGHYDPVFPANYVQSKIRAAIDSQRDFEQIAEFEPQEDVPHYIYRNVPRCLARNASSTRLR